MKLRYAPVIVATLTVFLLLANGCDVLKKNIATAGPQRYKSEVAAVAEDIKEQLDNDGKLKPATKAKFDGIIAKWDKDFGISNSMRNLKECQAELNKMDSDPNNAFQHKDNAQYNLTEALRNLETEVHAD